MPTYDNLCRTCGEEFMEWQSIHEPSRPDCPACGGATIRRISVVRTYGVGDRGAQTRWVDKSEKELVLDRGAYKRFRDEGHQPRHLKGSHRLEALAANDWEVKTGGLVSVPADRELEINEMMADAATGDWNPVEEMHRRKASK